MAEAKADEYTNSLVMSGLTAEDPQAATDRAAAKKKRDGTIDTYASGSTSSGWSQVGGLEDENRYAMSSLMVTDPKAYARQRLDALAEVKASVNSIYNTTRRQFLDAGLNMGEAEKRATAAAAATRKVGMTAMAAKYPISNDNKLLGVHRKETNKF